MKNNFLVISFPSLTQTSAAGISQLGYMLSQNLHQKGELKKFVVSSKGKFETTFPSSPVSFWSRYYLYFINRFDKLLRISLHQSRYIQELLFDFFCKQHLDKSVTAIVVTNPYLYRTFKKARKMGIPIFFIPGNPEDNFIAELVRNENEKYNITEDDPYTYPPRLDYYNRSVKLVDKVITYSSVMEESYRNAGFGEKLAGIRGYLKPDFKKVVRRSEKNQKFKVAYLAYTVLLKGLQYLLEAWKDLQDEKMELHIGGPIDKNVQQIIEREYSGLKNVFYEGPITDAGAFFSDKSIFVLPSIIDGAPVTALESLNSGVPVIITAHCGTKDIITHGENGWIIPAGNATAIKEKLLLAYQNPAKLKRMAQNASKTMEEYDMQDFVRTIEKVISE